jgi:hypothetical protein
MRSLGLDLGRKIKKCPRDSKLGFYIFSRNTMVYQCEETSMFRCFYELLGDIVLAFIEVLNWAVSEVAKVDNSDNLVAHL